MPNIVPKNKQRKYMIPFRSSDDEPFGLLKLNSATYDEALKMAKIVAGPDAAKFLCYNDIETNE